MLSSRKGINLAPDWFTVSEYERQFWEKAERHDDTMEKYSICKYPMSEAQLPAAMEKYGFKDVRTGYAAIDLTPDDPKYSAAMAHDIINARRYSDLDGIDSVLCAMPEHFTAEECEEMKRLTNTKYDTRIEQYDREEKQWDTNVSIIMVVRGIK